MKSNKRELLRRTLRSLAESHAATMELMEQTLVLLGEELAIDAVTFWKARISTMASRAAGAVLDVDRDRLQVVFHGRTCVLGNTLPFKLLERLARRPNTYVTHEELLFDVWDGLRSQAAIRSVVKRLRQALRRDGLADLAASIDGTASGRYRLRVEV
jgi:DNA-binding response OmpR family regulator